MSRPKYFKSINLNNKEFSDTRRFLQVQASNEFHWLKIVVADKRCLSTDDEDTGEDILDTHMDAEEIDELIHMLFSVREYLYGCK